jgi:hypothetical protein
MLRIFLVLSLAVSLAGVAFSFVLKDKVVSLTGQRDQFKSERDTAQANEAQAKSAEKKAREAEKKAKEELDTTTQELSGVKARLGEVEGTLTKTARELEETKVVRDTAQRELASWKATGVQPSQIMSLKAEAQRLLDERNVFAEEKKVMGREIVRLNDELAVYRGKSMEVIMPDVHGQITSVDGNFQFVFLDIGADNGLKQNGKLIVTRGTNLVGKVQLVRVEPRTAVANLLPDWSGSPVQAGDRVMTSYEALAR